MIRFPLLVFVTLALATTAAMPAARGQSQAIGTVVLQEDFSHGPERANPQAFGGGKTWDIPDTWEWRDGVVASLYDHAKHPGKAHGKSIDPKFKARDIRVRYRVKFEAEGARLDMIINAPLKPGKPGSVLWHIGDVVTRVTKPNARDDVSIGERDFTRDTNHPALAGKKLDPAVLAKPEGTFGSAYGIPGAAAHARIGLVTDRWYEFVVEAVGTRWTLWIDGKETLALDLKRADVAKESLNFIASGPLLLDDIVIEALPKP
jgi:hypothetical protein